MDYVKLFNEWIKNFSNAFTIYRKKKINQLAREQVCEKKMNKV